MRIFRQPARQDRSCRAPTNDNNVILHSAPHNGSSSFGMTSLGRDFPEYSTAWQRLAGWVLLQHANPIAQFLAVCRRGCNGKKGATYAAFLRGVTNAWGVSRFWTAADRRG